MTTKNVPPDLASRDAQINQRVDILERRLGRLEAAYEPELPFVQSGEVTVDNSPPWVRRKGGKLTEIVILLGIAGSSATVVQMRKNGTTIATGSLGSGVDQIHITLNEPAAADADRFVAYVTSAGSGAEDLTVETRWDQ